MQSYPLNLSSANASQVLGVRGDLFVYESTTIATRTNLLTASETLTTGWTGCDCAPTANSYKGSTYQRVAKKLSSGSEARSQDTIAMSAGQALTLKIALRADSASSVSIGLYQYGGSNWGVNADSTCKIISGPGQATVQSGSLFSITGLSNTQDTVVVITRTYQGAGTAGVYIYPGQSFSTTVGDAVQTTRLMLETGTVYGPYIATTTATASAAQGDNRVRIKSENGAEIILKPGQRVRMTDEANRWFVSLYDGETPMALNAIIGSGDFDDANTLATVKFDSSSSAVSTNANITNSPTVQGITNPVTVQGELEVKNDVGNALATADVQVYATAFNSMAECSAGLQIVAPAANVNGILLHRAFWGIINNVYMTTLLAKATAPTSATDGDILAMQGTELPNNGAFKMDKTIKIPAGKGLYMYSGGSHTAIKSALYTLL